MQSSPRLRPWRASDAQRLAHLGGRLSPETLRSRFWTGMSELSPSYLGSIERRWPHDWDAVVAMYHGQLVGWAEFGRNEPGSIGADAAFAVIDTEQGRGLGTALMKALVAQAAHAGVLTLHADISADNAPALHAWQRATQGLPATMTLSPDGYRGTISVPAAVVHAA